MAQTAEEQTAVVFEWLEKYCPTGLKTCPTGGLTTSDVEKIGQFIERNHRDIWSIAALNDAVEKLRPNLTWFDSSSEAVVIRNQNPEQRGYEQLYSRLSPQEQSMVSGFRYGRM